MQMPETSQCSRTEEPMDSGTTDVGTQTWKKPLHEDEKAKLRRKVHSLRMQVYRLQQQNRKTEIAKKIVSKATRVSNVMKAKKQKIATLREELSSFINGAQLDFVMTQVEMGARKARGRRWTNNDKRLALTLLHSSPKTYRLLRTLFALPSVDTLKCLMKNIEIYEGFNRNILEALQLKLASVAPASKVVAVTFDEMAIKTAISYDRRRDAIEGYSCGQGREKEIANHAMVFMVRGIVEKWKQPFGYFLCSGPMPGFDIAPLLKEGITLLNSIGLRVLVIVCDQGSNNVNLVEKQLGVCAEEPYFVLNGEKVFVMYDPPHLLKNVRNNLKNSGFEVAGEDVAWDHIREFYEADASKPIRLAPKLTEKHITLPPFAPLRVKLATQVLSHSVAVGMAVLAQWGIIAEEAAITANFVENMDQLFNAFNSQTRSSTAKMRHAYSQDSGHEAFLTEALEWISTVKTKGSRSLPCLKGWKQAIIALKQIWKVLHDEFGVSFLLTNRLNQDCVENLFSVIRGKGAQRDRPDAVQFRAALRQVMVDTVMLPGKGSNCSEDVGQFLCSLTSGAAMPAEPPAPARTYEEILRETVPDEVLSVLQVCQQPVNNNLTMQEINVIAYIAGYVVRKLRKKLCESCQEKSVMTMSANVEEHSFIQAKNYLEAKEGLIVPSMLITATLQQMETEFRRVIEDVMPGPRVKATLLATLLALDLKGLECQECQMKTLVTGLFINIRLHHEMREQNRSLSHSVRANRKTLKFAHR